MFQTFLQRVAPYCRPRVSVAIALAVERTLGKGITDTFKTPLTPEGICRHYKTLADVWDVMRQKVFCNTFQTHFVRFCITFMTPFVSLSCLLAYW